MALSDLNLSVKRGEIYGFLGRNGAGKSTTIRIIMGITKASSGALSLFGQPRQKSLIAQRQRIGYVAQEQNFYGWMTPVRLGRFLKGLYPTWDDNEYMRLLELLELPINRKTQTFSGGMKVKLALALALAHKPELLVLDEPTAGLDPVARREFLELIKAQAQASQRTTFFSTHLVDEIEMAAHKVGIVDRGQTLYEGPVENLVHRVKRLVHKVEGQPVDLPALLYQPIDGKYLFRLFSDEIREGQRQVAIEGFTKEAFDILQNHESLGSWMIEPLSLEEVFIEMVRRPMAQAIGQ